MLSQPTPARTSAITDIPDVAAARGIALADQSAARTQRIRAPSEAGAARIGRLPAFAPVRLAAIARSRIELLLDAAGIRVDGDAPTDIRVRDSRVGAWLAARGLR